jgi:hypothetical protein
MANVYYVLEVGRCRLSDDPGKWRLTVTQCVPNGSSVARQRLDFTRLFASEDDAAEYGSMWASVQRVPVIHASAITRLRSSFLWYGFDVSAYTNDQVTSALLQEAAAETPSIADLFVRAFQRLKRVEPNPVSAKDTLARSRSHRSRSHR